MTGHLVRSTGPEMDRHYRNVGLVAVAMAQLEEAVAYIVYASDGGWDNSDEHLRLMADNRKLRERLGNVVNALPADVETTHVDLDDGSIRAERGEVKRRVGVFADSVASLATERNRIVHSVVGYRLLDSESQAVHPRGIKDGDDDARRPLPSDDEIADLVNRIDVQIREGRHLSGRVAAIFDAGSST